ncbi:Enoyl-CoA hydratase [Phytophthora cinnamomi]|uniref:Enoyl-CoA hydratase n=1 Tax=Phytophthora cinnamomi TaxID=4785 RepID=UPI00355A9C11|nr:Enoyl-CoA hydratase [Phytophthora cinnamomi]
MVGRPDDLGYRQVEAPVHGRKKVSPEPRNVVPTQFAIFESLEDEIVRWTRERSVPGGWAHAGGEDQRSQHVSGSRAGDRVAARRRRERRHRVPRQGAAEPGSDDPSSQVTSRTLFQIGSVSKTFISFGIAIMVEEGKLSWGDPVKKHLPSSKPFDKYAEEYVTIGDLCAMNSGLNDLPDVGRLFGVYPTDEDLVAGLANNESAHTLRGGHGHANSNFAILGQVIKSVSGQPWDVYLQERVWDPLGMTRTFGSAFDTFGHVRERTAR